MIRGLAVIVVTGAVGWAAYELLDPTRRAHRASIREQDRDLRDGPWAAHDADDEGPRPSRRWIR